MLRVSRWQSFIALAGLLLLVESARAAMLMPSAIRQNLFAACFLDDREGWVVGELGRVFHTTDGGASFEQARTGTATAFTAIACFADRTLIVVGPKGTAMRSHNGGQTWDTVPTGTRRNLLSVSFATPQIGVAVGEFGTILRTQDGGTSWTAVPIPSHIPLPPEISETTRPGDIVLSAVTFPTADRGWIVGEFGVILASSDGGASWVPQPNPVATALFGVRFTDGAHGWAVGLESVMLRTADGGNTWTVHPLPTPAESAVAVYDVAVSGRFGWAVGDSGLLLRSGDGGATWHRAELPIELSGNWFRGVSLLPSGRGIIVGSGGSMLITDQGTVRELRRGS